MQTRITEIADRIYRLSTYVTDVAPPAGFTFNQFLVDADLAELVLYDGDPLAMVLGEDPVEQRRLSRSEETRQDGHRDLVVVSHECVLHMMGCVPTRRARGFRRVR